MGHTSGLTFRTAGVWGAGKGSNLTPAEVDENFYDLDERVDDLETNPPLPVEISSITVTGASMTVHMADSSSFGPFTLPTAPARAWLTGSGAPAAELGEEGDLYLDTATADVYQHQGTTGWVKIADLNGQIASVQTTDATQTVLASGAMAADSAHTIKARGHGREDATGDTYHFEIFGGARNEGGTSSAPTPNVIEVADAGAATWDATLVANDTSDEWEIKVTGEAAHTIDWTVIYSEIVTQP